MNTQKLDRNHPEVVSLVEQLQAQYGNIGKVSSFVGYANVDYLRTELYIRGWNSRLKADEMTVELFPVEHSEQPVQAE